VRIASFDEVLTMSAYLAVATGDEWWEHRYRRSRLQLRAATQEAEGLAPEPFMSQAAARADAARVELRAMEARSFRLMHEHDRRAALAVLRGEEYRQQQEAYMQARGEVTARARRQLRTAAQRQRRKAKQALMAAGAVLALLVFIWLGVTKITKAYIAQRRRSEEALSGANTVLQQEVDRRKAAEGALRAAKEAAEGASKAKSEFLAGMSHELRTPLNAIIGFSQILRERHFGELNAQQADYANDILESGQHLLSLINDILDLSKIEAGRMTLNLSEVRIARLLEHSTVMIKEKCRNHGIRLEADIPESLRDMGIIADERKIKQVIFNLLSNASKFTPDGGAITIALSQDDEGTTVSVADTGVGLSRDEREKVFEEFYQTAEGSAARAPGTGLGLPLVKRLAELHGGKLWVESEGRNKGSRFSFLLPLAASPVEEEQSGAERPTLNVINDEEDLRRWLAPLIQESRTARDQVTICVLRTQPQLSKAEAAKVATELLREKRPGDHLGIDWEGHVYLILRGVGAEAAVVPCGRMMRRAAQTLGRANITWDMVALPEDGEAADALLTRVGVVPARDEAL